MGWKVLVTAWTLFSTPGIISSNESVGGGLCAESGIQDQLPQRRAEAEAEDILGDPKRCLQLICSLSSRDETPSGSGETGCLRLCGSSLRTFCCGVPVEIQANPELCVSDEHGSCPSYAPKGTGGDTQSQKPSSPAPWDQNVLNMSREGRLSAINRETQAPPHRDDGADRSVRNIASPRSCLLCLCETERADGSFSGPQQGTSSAAALCSLEKEVLCYEGWLCSAEDMPKMLLRRSSGPPPGTACTCSLPTSWYHAESPPPVAQHPPGPIPATQAENAGRFAVCYLPETGAQAPPALGIRVQQASGTALCLLVDFGDGRGAGTSLCAVAGAAAVTGYHWYRKEGVYKLRAVVHDVHGADVELGPYYVDIGRENVSVFMNSSSIHDGEALSFADSLPQQKGTVVMHCFSSVSSYNVSFISQTQVDSSPAWLGVTVGYQMQPVSICTNGTAFAADTDITFVAVTKETLPLEFTWYLGDDPPVRTTSRSIRRRLSIPQWYPVMVKATSRIGSVLSESHLIRVQKRIIANRLVSTASALVKANVSFECRLNFGTDVTYLWNFGDGTTELGRSFSSHVYSREGEFTVEVLAFNNVSSAILRKQLFIVHEPCQPPPVKNMGPKQVQIWRSQPLRLGVTFEAAVLCNMPQGLLYTWSIVDARATAVTLPAAVNTHRQTIMLPGYTLECGNYSAVAKVQIKGSVVYSNYCVGVEVRPRAPVSVISEGTHIFIPRATTTPVVLRGFQSYDPDNPGAALRYHWTCTAASSPRWPCFEDSTLYQVDTQAPSISFPAKWLSECCDQFLVTLTVSSNGQNSSRALIFLSTRPDPAFRFVHISWVHFRDTRVNWNEELSFRAVCEDCGDVPDLTYSWDLFLVNATEKTTVEVPFCSTVGLLGSSAFGALLKLPQSGLQSNSRGSLALHSPQQSPVPPSWTALPNLGSTSTESTAADPHIPMADPLAGSGELMEDYGSLSPAPDSLEEQALMMSTPEGSWPPSSSSPAFDDFEAYYSDIQEDVPSQGRQPGTNFHESGPSMVAEESASDGDRLLGPSLHTGRAKSALMIDWPKTLVSRAVFHGYTSSGIVGPAVTIKPFSLSKGEMYVLQASTASKHVLLGKAQLYITVNQVPRDMSCQVRPHSGLEAHTIFSVFCMSGRPDFHYEFHYQIGNTSPHTLYRGRDTQYYFLLPAGETSDNYKVIVSTEITDGQGSKVQPCTVEVTVLPRYHGNDCPDKDLYDSALETLSSLQLVGSYTEVRNYIAMATAILSRLHAESRNTSTCGLWSQIQDVLVSSACKVPFTDQEAMMDSIHILRDLINFPNKLSLMSAMHILKYAQMFLTQGQFSRKLLVNKKLGVELILLISGVWEAAKEDTTNEDYLQEEGMMIISDMLLACLSLNHQRQLHISTGQAEFWTLLHHSSQSSVQNLGFIGVRFPRDMALHGPAQEESHSPCYVSQLMVFRSSPYPVGQAPGQVGAVVRPRLYSCKSRQPILRGRLEMPVTVEFGEEDHWHKRNPTMFTLIRDGVNLHRFVGLSEKPQETLQIRIEFSKPVTRAFPIMLLVRFSKKATPSDFLVKQVYFWDEQTVQIYVPAVPLKGANVGYLSLLDADYDRRPPNKYLAGAVNYTVNFQWIQCVFWDKTGWRSEGPHPQPGSSPEKVNCSYRRLAPFSVLRRKLSATLEVSSISGFRSHPRNLLPGIFSVFLLVVYGFLMTKSRCVDCHKKKKPGCIFLEEDTPPGHQLYAVIVDTGFRSPAQFTSKVFIVLCGENGLSETKELCCPQMSLFGRNSRHTFVLSTPNQLGPLRKIRLWHDSSGPSPNWFISHMMVKELHSGQCWFFPAQCWLAVSLCDGRVQRELFCQRHGLGFWKLFYSKLTEYLEDFHIWLSLYSQPPSSSYLLTQRLAVSFCLLCVYACLTALVAVGVGEQRSLDVGPTVESFSLGLLCTTLACPLAQLLSLLFRFSKATAGHGRAAPQWPLGGVKTEAPQGSDHSGRQSWRQPFQHPASDILPATDGAWRMVASGSGVACPSFLAVRERNHQPPPSSQAPSSGFKGPVPQRSRVCLLWSRSVAWAICGSVSLSCGLGTGFLGYRFVPAQCVWWLHLLLLSVVCCMFVTQPLMICLAALAFAWKRKHDSQFFIESLHDATRDLDLELEEYSRAHILHSGSSCSPDSAEEAGRVLAARQRERHLRWAQPPSRAKFRVTRERLKKESQMQASLRDLSMHSLTLLLLLFITYGRFCPGEYSLNQAIRKGFTRNARHSFGNLSSTDDWWDWTVSTLLDGLYPEGPATGASGTQPGALRGRCHLIGPSVIQQWKVSSGAACTPPRPVSELMEDALSTSTHDLDLENRNVTPGGPEVCGEKKESFMHSLGRTRHEAHSALTALRANRWIDHSTRAMYVHFTLYNPPMRLFTSVTLGAEFLPTGGLVPSSLVESFSIFDSDSVPQSLLMLSELVFLVLNMTHLCFQFWEMATKGVLSYWRKPRHWLELSMVGVALAYYAVSGHLTTLAENVNDQFHKGLHQMFVDLSRMVSWNQRARWLRGSLLFLWMLKGAHLLGLLNTMASFSAVTRSSLSRAFAPALLGSLLLAAHFHLYRFLLFTWTPSPGGTSTDAFPGLLPQFLGISHRDSPHNHLEPGRQAVSCYRGALFLLVATLCFRMLRASLLTFFRKRKSFHRKSLVTLKNLAVYARHKFLALLGLEATTLEETELATDHSYYLDEFSSLLDELLVKIDGLSDNLELSILEEQWRRGVDSRAVDSPSAGLSGCQATGQTRE
ncbi:polycystic kidney disease protein 1-like 1 [Mesocricetus auratus]|uniref:Polycystic kidney disease protein 1-like 1 n=1 Tax=Mesocricetus auratus TaxID=10036 RepID=A0ABM2XLV3_MESAU|nr:polycystic kidney disease protein 1-like 1 [Mesocricetus auratus]